MTDPEHPRSRPADLRVVPAGDVPFADVESVFGTRGDPATCWCQWYKIRGAEWKATAPPELRDRLAAQLSEPGPGPGLLAHPVTVAIRSRWWRRVHE
jgi:hypothetical protein